MKELYDILENLAMKGEISVADLFRQFTDKLIVDDGEHEGANIFNKMQRNIGGIYEKDGKLLVYSFIMSHRFPPNQLIAITDGISIYNCCTESLYKFLQRNGLMETNKKADIQRFIFTHM